MTSYNTFTIFGRKSDKKYETNKKILAIPYKLKPYKLNKMRSLSCRYKNNIIYKQ